MGFENVSNEGTLLKNLLVKYLNPLVRQINFSKAMRR